MKKLVFNYTAHKALNEWLSAHPNKHRWEWPEWDYNGGTHKDIFSESFACDYALAYVTAHHLRGDICDHCPMKKDPYAYACLQTQHDDAIDSHFPPDTISDLAREWAHDTEINKNVAIC